MRHNTHYGISLELANLEEYFKQSSAAAQADGVPPPVVINDVARRGDALAVREVVNSHLRYRIVDEALNNEAICSHECSNPITKNYNVGVKCPTCGYTVAKKRLRSELWVEAPESAGVFVNPRFWNLFNVYFANSTITNFERDKITLNRGPDIMAWMVDPTYKVDPAHAKQKTSRFKSMIEFLDSRCYQRGIDYFSANFMKIMEMLTEHDFYHNLMKSMPDRKSTAKKYPESESSRQYWIALCKQYQSTVFTRYLPLISPMLIVSEESDTGIIVDPVPAGMVDAAKTIGSIYTHSRQLRPRDEMGRAMRANRQIAQFYTDWRRETASRKTGHYRSKLGSTFVPFSGRATITPITEPHDPFALVGPWRWSVNFLKPEIESKLLDQGISPKKICKMIDYACMQYCPKIHEVLKTLVKESPGGRGIYVTPLRNPTLVQLSVEGLYLNEFLTDVRQCSVRISVLVIKAMNADFDGDQIMFYRPQDGYERTLAEGLRPDNGIMSSRSPNEVADFMTLHNELISIQNAFISDDEEDEYMGTGLGDL